MDMGNDLYQFIFTDTHASLSSSESSLASYGVPEPPPRNSEGKFIALLAFWRLLSLSVCRVNSAASS